ncbi:MAG: fatty acid desaturase [Acidimicrobiales bacterium]|nr:fatty acid desaturase [Acidimicrobiales bacterium]
MAGEEVQERTPETDATRASSTRQINQVLGPAVVRSLHKQNVFIDAGVGVGLLALVVALAVGLGTVPIGLLWFGMLIAQGFLLQILAFFAHDVFVHRAVGGRRFARMAGSVFATPATVVFSEYRHLHFAHHRHVNGPGDSEEYKRDFDRRWVKWALLTPVGTQLSWFGVFRRGDRKRWEPDYTVEEARMVKQETRALIAVFAGLVGLAFLSPGIVLRGYFLPLLVVAPIASSLRVILEHADVDVRTPLASSTFYRTGPISGPLFLWGAGDCHLVHHLYPAIPFYRMRRAVRLIEPVLIDAGVRQHRSFAKLLYGWFIRNEAHGTSWRLADS